MNLWLRQVFFPMEIESRMRSRSGVETLAAGYQFRFGAGTVFSLNRTEITVEQGALLINSRRLSNQVNLLGPESKLSVSGVGCCLINVEPNGGFKAVGLLGKISLNDSAKGESFMLLPGQLVFQMPGGRGFGDEVSVNLNKLIESSYLVSGFPNSSSFRSSLASMTDAQAKWWGKPTGRWLEVPDSLILSKLYQQSNHRRKPGLLQISLPPAVSYDKDPLSELLGPPA